MTAFDINDIFTKLDVGDLSNEEMKQIDAFKIEFISENSELLHFFYKMYEKDRKRAKTMLKGLIISYLILFSDSTDEVLGDVEAIRRQIISMENQIRRYDDNHDNP